MPPTITSTKRPSSEISTLLESTNIDNTKTNIPTTDNTVMSAKATKIAKRAADHDTMHEHTDMAVLIGAVLGRSEQKLSKLVDKVVESYQKQV